MRREQVVSGNLHSVGYDPATLILEIEFNSGSVYQYYGVPNAVFQGLMQAPSHGEYFHANIRNRFRYSQVS
jgi:hypothetical protein